MEDDFDSLDCCGKAIVVGDVSVDQLRSGGLEVSSVGRFPNKGAYVISPCQQGFYEVAPQYARAPGDQRLH